MQQSSWRWRLAQWLEIRWWKNYLASKQPKEYLAQKKAYWQRTLTELKLPLSSSERVLDVGCGPAGIFMVLEDYQVDAIDPLLNQYHEGLVHFEPKQYPWVNFHHAGVEQYTASEAYDTVFCLNVINHVNQWDHSLNQLTQLTKNKGHLVLGVDVHNHQLLKHIFQMIPGDVLHPHQHDKTDYRQALNKRGWTILSEHTIKSDFIFDYWILVAQKK